MAWLAWLAAGPLVVGLGLGATGFGDREPGAGASPLVCGTGSLRGWQLGPGFPSTGVDLPVYE